MLHFTHGPPVCSILGRVRLVSEVLSQRAMVQLYEGADAFVLATHGEGWGLPIMEAMASGVPAIATDWGGQTEFMDANNSWPVRICARLAFARMCAVPAAKVPPTRTHTGAPFGYDQGARAHVRLAHMGSGLAPAPAASLLPAASALAACMRWPRSPCASRHRTKPSTVQMCPSACAWPAHAPRRPTPCFVCWRCCTHMRRATMREVYRHRASVSDATRHTHTAVISPHVVTT